MESIKVRIRHLLFAHHEELITDDECQDETTILYHRAEMLHPIPLDRAVAKMSALAEAHTTSVLATDRGAG